MSYNPRQLNFRRDIIAALDGPKNVKSVTFHSEVGRCPTVTYVCLVKPGAQLNRLAEVVAKYKVVKRKVKVV